MDDSRALPARELGDLLLREGQVLRALARRLVSAQDADDLLHDAAAAALASGAERG